VNAKQSGKVELAHEGRIKFNPVIPEMHCVCSSSSIWLLKEYFAPGKFRQIKQSLDNIKSQHRIKPIINSTLQEDYTYQFNSQIGFHHKLFSQNEKKTKFREGSPNISSSSSTNVCVQLESHYSITK